jgi:hypothetical protein
MLALCAVISSIHDLPVTHRGTKASDLAFACLAPGPSDRLPRHMPDESGRKDEWWRQKRWWMPGMVLVLLIVVGLLVGVIVVPPRLIHMRQPDTTGLGDADRAKIQAQFETDRTKAENDLRATLVTTLAGVAVAAGTGVAALNFTNSRKALEETQRQNRLSRERDRDQLELTRRGQVTERFSKAIDQLGERGEKESEKLDVRIGAIYALEQIARDTRENKVGDQEDRGGDREDEAGDLHWPIVEILTAFIRGHPPQLKPDDQASYEDLKKRELREQLDERDQQMLQELEKEKSELKVAADIQVALTVLARRESSHRDRGLVDLKGANLQGAQLSVAKLQKAMLTEANLQGAFLIRANLQGAFLRKANLQGAVLYEANLQKADLPGANLQNAILRKANLQGADLQNAHGLTQEQLDSATCNEETKLSAGLTVNVNAETGEEEDAHTRAASHDESLS